MEARLRRKLEKLGRLPEKEVPQWKDYFPFERILIEKYQIVKGAEPDNPLLLEGEVNTNGHFEFSSERWNIPSGDGKYFKFDPVPIADQNYDSVKQYIIKMIVASARLKRGLTGKLNLVPYSDGEK